MTSLIAKIWSRLRNRRVSLSIMLVGLDSSGKTSILNHLATVNNSRSLSREQATCKSSKNDQDLDNRRRSSRSPSRLSLAHSGSNVESTNQSSGNIMPTVGYNYERINYKQLTITVLDFSGQNRYRNLWQEFFNGVDAIVFVIDSSDLIRLVVVRDELETMLGHPYFTSLTYGETNGDDVHQRHQLFPASLIQQRQITINQGKLIQSPLIDEPIVDNKLDSSDQSLSSRLSKTLASAGGSYNGNCPKRRTKVPILFLANKCDLANSVDTEVIIKALDLNRLPVDRHPWFIQATSVNSNSGIAEAFDWLAFQLSGPLG